MKKRERDSGMELLRIFAMLLVICVHMFSYGGFYTAAKAVGGHVHSTALLMKLASRSGRYFYHHHRLLYEPAVVQPAKELAPQL